MKLDFTFDAELAKLTEEKVSKAHAAHSMDGNRLRSHQTTAIVSMNTPISPSTADLNLKIASVKKVSIFL